MPSLIRVWPVVVMLAACSDDPVPVELVNEGTACMTGDTPGMFPSDEAIHIKIDWPNCVGSSCATDVMATCTTSVIQRTVIVESRASWTDTSGGSCSDGCNTLTASCDTPTLLPDSYTFVLGNRSVAITVPSTVTAAPCI